MRKINLLVALVILVLLGCARKPEVPDKSLFRFAQYSKSVGDTFHISVQIPLDYDRDVTRHYPTVVLLDGNFYFPMMAATLREYEEAGLLPPMILVGVGYQSFQQMDSLRVRDYLYPESIPSDEMEAVGGGLKFNEYLTQELLPGIDSTFRTERGNRALMGHSFGGYFVLYSLLHQLEENSHHFRTFVSASPSLWYHDFYLNRISDAVKERTQHDSLNIFLSVGALEDSTWSVNPVKNLANKIERGNFKEVNLQNKIYSDLDHMDVGVLSFTKGLQEFYK